MSEFVFRFDIDTYTCLRKGVPNLLKLAAKYRIPFTFFMNMGKATSRLLYVKKVASRILRRMWLDEVKEYKLPILTKLGWEGFLVTSIFNPRLGQMFRPVLGQIQAAGCELGLHGGRNHGMWQRYGKFYTTRQILAELTEMLGDLFSLGIVPEGFVSPDWQGSENLNVVLSLLGFTYLADTYGESYEGPFLIPGSSLYGAPVNIVGAGGVGYIEYMKAKRYSDAQIVADFARRIRGRSYAVMYDHPCYAGVGQLALFESLIEQVLQQGYTVTTLQDILYSYAKVRPLPDTAGQRSSDGTVVSTGAVLVCADTAANRYLAWRLSAAGLLAALVLDTGSSAPPGSSCGGNGSWRRVGSGMRILRRSLCRIKDRFLRQASRSRERIQGYPDGIPCFRIKGCPGDFLPIVLRRIRPKGVVFHDVPFPDAGISSLAGVRVLSVRDEQDPPPGNGHGGPGPNRCGRTKRISIMTPGRDGAPLRVVAQGTVTGESGDCETARLSTLADLLCAVLNDRSPSPGDVPAVQDGRRRGYRSVRSVLSNLFAPRKE